MKSKLMPTVVLTCICLVVALMLAGINMVTEPIIKAAQDAATNAALLEVLPDAKDFEPIKLDGSYPKVVDLAYKAEGGYVFRMNVTGKSSGLIVMCGIDSEGKVVGTKVISDNETPDYSKNVYPFVEGTDGAYKGMTLEGFDPYLVSKATLTSAAYSEAIKAALQSFVIASGGSVDLRTPEEIFQDECNAALGTEGVKFEKWLKIAALDGVDEAYVADGRRGYVFVIGDELVAVSKIGDVVSTDASSEAMSIALAAYDTVMSVTLTKLDAIPDGVSTSIVKSIYSASNGAYLFELDALGYQMSTDYGTQVPISIKLVISADGKIADLLTVSHEESKGFGDVCGKDDYYEDWIGAGASDITLTVPGTSGTATDIGVISGATYTSRGYQQAIKSAFTAFEKLTAGGAE